MNSSVRFTIDGLSAVGEWDKEKKTLFLNELSSTVTLLYDFMGKEMNIQGILDVTPANAIRFKVESIGWLPPVLIPSVLKLFKIGNSSLAKFGTVDGDAILIELNRLIE